MIITVGIKNTPSGSVSWKTEIVWAGQQSVESPKMLLTGEYTYDVPTNIIYLTWRVYNASGYCIVYESSGWLTVVEGATYIIDDAADTVIQSEGGPAPIEDTPTWVKGAAMLWPWSPLFGPPLPKGFFPPWPMWMSRWTEIPGYPKVPEEGELAKKSGSGLILS